MRLIVFILVFVGSIPAAWGQDLNYRDRQAYVIEGSPFIELSDFSFSNEFRNRNYRLITELSWTNVGEQPVTAFEVVVAYFDPFNRPIRSGGRWLVSGKNSGDWTPLAPGEKSSDGLIGYRAQDAFTAVAYVRAIRLEDGTVWTANEDEVRQQVQRRLPEVRSFENLSPPLDADGGQEG